MRTCVNIESRCDTTALTLYYHLLIASWSVVRVSMKTPRPQPEKTMAKSAARNSMAKSKSVTGVANQASLEERRRPRRGSMKWNGRVEK